jgi:hypothetical protein
MQDEKRAQELKGLVFWSDCSFSTWRRAQQSIGCAGR